MDATSPSPKSGCVLTATAQHVWDRLTRPPPPQDYPPVSSIPRTTPSRLALAAPTDPTDQNFGEKEKESTVFTTSSSSSSPSSSNVLYLAYGSNLCAETFLGRRGIRPVSAVPVTAPSLRLTFDLPGFAYQEPCFANVAPREVPKPPKIPPGWPRPDPPPGLTPPPLPGVPRSAARGDVASSSWDKGLVGVVYEVTPEDYATILKTEGGGASYHEILVPCFPFPERPPGVPEKPPAMPELPKFFLALTLCAPRIPNKPPGDGDEDKDAVAGRRKDDGDDDDGWCKKPLDRLKDWWKMMLLQPVRPDPDYAQPSARYLKLITDGAAEHELPVEYQRWLASLQPYTITSCRQAVGKWLFLTLLAPWMLLYFVLAKLLAGEDGRVPAWFGLATGTFFHLVWRVYDRGFKPVFGDGERTVDKDDDEEEEESRGGRKRRGGRAEDGDVEEKAGLLSG